MGALSKFLMYHSCMLVANLAEKNTSSVPSGGVQETHSFVAQMRNSVGAIVNLKKLPFAPKLVALGISHG